MPERQPVNEQERRLRRQHRAGSEHAARLEGIRHHLVIADRLLTEMALDTRLPEMERGQAAGRSQLVEDLRRRVERSAEAYVESDVRHVDG